MRLALVCHGPTAATRGPRFPADEPLEEGAAARIAALPRRWPGRARALTSPLRRARETAAALNLTADVEPALRDADAGAWVGRSLDEVEAADPVGLEAWLAHGAAPPGGEAGEAVARRVAAWLAACLAAGHPVVAVTHAAVIRAAVATVLGAPVGAARLIDVAPMTVATFGTDGRRWRLTGLVPP